MSEAKSIEAPAATRRSLIGNGDLGESLVYVCPLVLLYQLGILFSGSINGADFVTWALLAAVQGDRSTYLVMQLVLALSFILAALVLRRRRALSLRDALPMLLESTIYALTLGAFIVVLMDSLFGMAFEIEGPHELGNALGPTGRAIVASMGAGVYEEVVFRLGLFVGLAALLRAIGVRHALAILASAIAASLLFSLAHHLGPQGEPLVTRVFVYRAIAGLVFTSIFYFRSLAHSVYAHFLYDVYVLVVHP